MESSLELHPIIIKVLLVHGILYGLIYFGTYVIA
jgi:hypothetical protein